MVVDRLPHAVRSWCRPGWRGTSQGVRAVVAAAVVVFGCGTLAHVGQLVSGLGAPRPGLPTWLAAFSTSLVALDPLVAVLVLLGRRAGLVLATVVLVADAVAGGWAAYALDARAGVTPGRIGQAVVSALAVGMVVALPWLWRWSAAGRSAAGTVSAPRRDQPCPPCAFFETASHSFHSASRDS